MTAEEMEKRIEAAAELAMYQEDVSTEAVLITQALVELAEALRRDG
jgi:hypothetical protein